MPGRSRPSTSAEGGSVSPPCDSTHPQWFVRANRSTCSLCKLDRPKQSMPAKMCRVISDLAVSDQPLHILHRWLGVVLHRDGQFLRLQGTLSVNGEDLIVAADVGGGEVTDQIKEPEAILCRDTFFTAEIFADIPGRFGVL